MQEQQKKQEVPQQVNNSQPNNEIAHQDAHQQSVSSKSYSSSSYSSGSKSSPSHSHHSQKQEQPEKLQQNAPQGEGQPKNDNNEPQGQRKIRYKYCCKVCKHTDKVKKACVCVVPKNQRRTQIGEQGCQTCGCIGCSKEDFISRGEDPEYRPGQKTKRHRRERDKDNMQFEARNGCCRKCMKAFSKSNKSCLCQVPEDVRNTKLPSSGCKICGCFGCNPEDKKDPRNRKATKKERERSRSRQKKKKNRSKQSQSESKQYIDHGSMNFYNVDKSVLGGMITNEYRLDPCILGFGIPQRTYNYILGKPK